MTIFPGSSVRPTLSRGDVLITVSLAVVLSVALGLDLSAYRRAGKFGEPGPDFALLQPRGSHFIGSSQFLPVQADTFVRLENFSTERHYHRLRHGLGPLSTIEVYSSRTHARLDLQYNNLIPGQELTFTCNQQVLEHLTALPVGPLRRTYALDLRPGANRFAVTYARYNHAGGDYAPADPRPLAGNYTTLDLFLD